MVNVLDPFGLEKGGGFFATDSPRAIHGDPPRAGLRQQGAAFGAEPVGEVAEALCVGLHRAFERADLAFVGVARVDHQGFRIGDEGVPVGGRDIDAGVARRVQVRLAHGDDLGLHPHLHAMKRQDIGPGVFQFQPIEARQGVDGAQHRLHAIDRPGDGAVQPLMGDQQRAPHLPGVANGLQPVADRGGIGDQREAIQRRHADGLFGRGGDVGHVRTQYAPRQGWRAQQDSNLQHPA